MAMPITKSERGSDEEDKAMQILRIYCDVDDNLARKDLPHPIRVFKSVLISD